MADLLALVCDVYCDFVTFPCGIPGQVWYLIVSIPDPCCLSYFHQCFLTAKINYSLPDIRSKNSCGQVDMVVARQPGSLNSFCISGTGFLLHNRELNLASKIKYELSYKAVAGSLSQ